MPLTQAELELRARVLKRALDDFEVTRVGWFFMPLPPGPDGKLQSHYLGDGTHRLQ